jgi:hypothetical protein
MESRHPRGRVVKATIHLQNPNPQPVTVANKKPTVTATRKTARPKKPESKAKTYPKPAGIKPKNKAAASDESAAAKPTTPKLAVPTQSSNSPLKEVSDLLDHLIFKHASRLFTSVSSLPGAAARPRADLKTTILFEAEYGSTS